jgi:hypothetical protein
MVDVVLGIMHRALRELKSGTISSNDLLQSTIAPEVMRRLTGAQEYADRMRKYNVTRR